ncbi:metal transporter [uncultured Flavobacterium sp.]|uniref:heavy-metal-associated domain-containing protein n=1 Tax=uncultured Flavobacterium sp. TaxID=165435 RepID=UPI0030EBC36E
MKKLILVLLLSFVGFSMNAQDKAVKKSKNKEVIIKAAGNCEMCEKRIEKAAFSVKGVKSAEWHVDCQDIHVIIDENKCTKEDVAKAIANVGHDTDIVRASDEAYEEMHECCQYDRIK